MSDDGAYPEDWQEQGWCCRECAVMAWYGMSLELRREFAADVAARRPAMSDGPGLVCPGCGSPDVDLRRGLLCGTCAEAAAEEGGGSGG